MSADYVMVGGFLGAGKTTAMLRLAEHFTSAGRRVGLITNDQSRGLVDTTLLSSRGFPTTEITGGCFCCRFNSLTDAADRLTRDARPDVFLAEPVGSCTDLRATVQYPLSRLYGSDYRVAPLSVLVDPTRAARVLGLEPGGSFSPKVVYIYEKQLEEADIIVINKSDLLAGERRERLADALRVRFPNSEVIAASARTGANLETWFAKLSGPMAARQAMEVDYDVYADGEALLGWLNATVRLSAAVSFDGNALLRQLASGVHERLGANGIEIAHFKMTLAPDTGEDLGVLNLVRNDGEPDSPFLLADELTDGELILNLRAEGEPKHLKAAVEGVLADLTGRLGITATIEHLEHFKPGRPVPTHPDGERMNGRILYRHCAYAKVVPVDVKTAVLGGLSEAGVEFDAVPDLCEMAAQGDHRLRELAEAGPLRIAACYPRAVKWLFASAQAPLSDSSVQILNMRTHQAGDVLSGLLGRAAPATGDDAR